ncbi:MAG: YvcK family protein [Firmicutes bacterium]|nr:YvcK family protein [Bacillota bacterium]
MSFKHRPKVIAVCWLVCLLVCLSLIGTGITISFDIWKIRVLEPWGRILIGIILTILGFSLGYLSTLKFFWTIVTWLAKYERIRNGKTGKGPKVVVIGGGTGLGTILRGLKEITPHLTAIVTVADDGGSSGRLRREFGILPPGDIRNCLVAMADMEPLMEKLFQYRFTGSSNLAGHNFGNLFITAMTEITGDFEVAIKESSKVLAVRGQVLPATTENVILKAELADGRIVTGESEIPKAKMPIKKVFLEPRHCKPVTEAVTALEEADIIILGPGSLYTSIIPNLLVTDIAETVRNSKAVKVYVCNAMTQAGETDNYSAGEHLKAIMEHAGPGLVDIALVNNESISEEILKRYTEEDAQPVRVDLDVISNMGITPLAVQIITKTNYIRHDASKVARLILGLYRTQGVSHTFGKLITKQLLRFLKSCVGFFIAKLS